MRKLLSICKMDSEYLIMRPKKRPILVPDEEGYITLTNEQEASLGIAPPVVEPPGKPVKQQQYLAKADELEAALKKEKDPEKADEMKKLIVALRAFA